MGENFRRKARFVSGGHTTKVPDSIITYYSVVSRDSVTIALTNAGLNGLQVMACDIQNAYLTADCREKIWTVAGPEFGSEAGTIFYVRKALYGLKSAGAAFRSLWHSKRQNTVEASTFGSEFQAMKNAVELTEAMRYKLRMFGVLPVVPRDNAMKVFCDNEEAVYKELRCLSRHRRRRSITRLLRCREAVEGEYTSCERGYSNKSQ